MQTYKAYRFRIYPTPEQLERLARWEFALRWLWNIANEQRTLGLTRCDNDKVYVRYAAQNRELTLLRSLCPWLNDVPSPLCQSVLRDLDTAWERHYRGLTRRPRYKSRAKDHRTALRVDAGARRFRLNAEGIEHFPKLGRLKTVLHRAIEGKPKSCALVREGQQWFVSVTCQIEMATAKPRSAPSVGIARAPDGVCALSTGRIIRHHANLSRTQAQLKRALRTLKRRTKGSNRRERARQRVVQLEYRERRQRAHVLHVESRRIANSHGNVIAEISSPVSNDWSSDNADWHGILAFIKYKLAWSGGLLLEFGPPQRAEAEDDRIRPDVGVAAAIRILNAWESLASARGRHSRVKRESAADRRQTSLRQGHRAASS